ncbi:MAG: site-specific DNA-methyltransferase [Bacillota bacterium]
MPDSPVNRIYLGDNLPIMRECIEDQSVGLIYLDPPFNSRATYNLTGSAQASADRSVAFDDVWGWNPEAERALESITEDGPHDLARLMAALKQMLGPGDMMAYLVMMGVRLREMHRVLKPTGSLYLHCDPTGSHYLKLILDAIFGSQHFQREIVWRIGWISGYKSQARNWIRNHDIILFYSRSAEFTFNKEYLPYPPGYTRRDGSTPEGRGIPMEDTWNCQPADSLNSIMIMSFSAEKTGYPTQKPEALLRRIVAASSNRGDVVMDPFCGSGTTAVVAEEMGRRWIAIDQSETALTLAKERLKERYGSALSPHRFVNAGQSPR